MTVNGLSATISNGEYSREIEIGGGWNTIDVTATSSMGKHTHRRADVFLAASLAQYGYDYNGNMTSMPDATGTVTLGYDAADRLTSIAYPDSRPATSYTYNGRNKKVTQTVGTEITGYLWDWDQIVRELDGAGLTRATLIHGLGLGADVGSLVKAERSGQNQFFHYDWRGSVTNLTDSSNAIIKSYTYDAFGNVTASSGSAVNPYQFSSKQFDGNSGLSYFGRRHYSAQVGRFTAQDPKGYIEGLNTYADVKNNPINLWDPLGLDPGDTFFTWEEAGEDAIKYINSTSQDENLEYGGYIYENDDETYSYTIPCSGDNESVDYNLDDPPECTIADYHTHGAYDPDYCNEIFSEADKEDDIDKGIYGFLGTPSSRIKFYDPETDSTILIGETE